MWLRSVDKLQETVVSADIQDVIKPKAGALRERTLQRPPVCFPARRKGAQRSKKCSVFRRKGRDDLFETRIAAERIPHRIQFQLAIPDTHNLPCGDGQLFEGQV